MIWVWVVCKPKAFVSAIFFHWEEDAVDWSRFLENFLKLLFTPLFWKALNVNVRKTTCCGFPLFLWNEFSNCDFLFSNNHAVDFFDSLFSRLWERVMDEPISTRFSFVVSSNLA